MSDNRVLTIVCSKGAELGRSESPLAGEYEVIDKYDLLKRVDELTDEGWGYSILIAEPRGTK